MNEDPINVAGLSFLVNDENIDDNKKDKLKEIEEEIIGLKGGIDETEINIDNENQREFEKLQKQIGVSINTGKSIKNIINNYDDSNEYSDDNDSDVDSESEDESDDDDSGSDDESGSDLEFSDVSSDESSDDHKKHRHKHKHQSSVPTYGYGKSEVAMTEEEKRRAKLNSLVKGYGAQEADEYFSLDKEEEMDEKYRKIEHINTMRDFLEDEPHPVDLSRIPFVDEENSLTEIKRVEGLLTHKYNRKRYANFGNQWIMIGVHGLEKVFDGKKKYLGYSPDLTGIHNEAYGKLKLSKHETATFVADLAKKWNIGPVVMLILDFIPFAISYSARQKEQKNTQSYAPSPEDFRGTIDALHDFEDGY